MGIENPVLTEFQCRWCWTLVNPDSPDAVVHPGLGLVHGKCAKAAKWGHGLPGIDPLRFLDDAADTGRGQG